MVEWNAQKMHSSFVTRTYSLFLNKVARIKLLQGFCKKVLSSKGCIKKRALCFSEKMLIFPYVIKVAWR